MTPKKIFITIPWFLPAFRAGGPIKSIANLVKEWRDGAEYYIFCGDTDINGAQLENIETNTWSDFQGYAQVWYNGPENISDNLVKQVEAVKPDILFIIGMYSWHYNIVPLIFCKAGRKILSTRGMLHPGGLAQKKLKKKVFLSLFKLLEYHYKVDFHATAEEERNFIKDRFGEPARIFVAGNFPDKIPLLPMAAKEAGHLKIVTVALLSPMKNILLVLDALEKATAEIQYDIYGPVKDEDYWDLCRERMRTMPSNVSVVYHKEIAPQEVPAVLAQSHVFVLPSKSENFGHSIVEALSAGRPVITSMHTPWKELEANKAGMNVSVDGTIGLSDAMALFAAMDKETFREWHCGAAKYAANASDVQQTREAYRAMFSADSNTEKAGSVNIRT